MRFNNRKVKTNWKELSGYEETENINILLGRRMVKITDKKNKIVVSKSTRVYH